ncbi:ammonium transporter [Leptothoe kymatousa]|uniref:histidine kinase n=1 Tax=Leptothoe kymatousa TAU-MAC 1615 TaxID=2364775 RepID=A0ABS5Y7D5_9CYAN|nr:ammonium transporter [Leptothoe kymatousa]MBT9313733.1 ammonium transporter [Leptothoe kymatousa TAU-MAC 1615]
MPLSLDALWVVISACLVFIMQAGFLCIEAGSTRRKNNINVAIKNLADAGISIIIFWACGYGIMFGPSVHGLWGSQQFFPEFHQDGWSIIFFVFQTMFCSTAVTIMSGAVAERMTFRGYLCGALLISGLIYPLYGHWVWNGLNESLTTGWLGQKGFVDFAGSTVVHSLGGWVALAALIIIGPRLGRFSRHNFSQQTPSADLPLAFLGTLLLWFGWFGFNGGSTLAFNEQVPRILGNTLLAGAAGLVTPLVWSIGINKRQVHFRTVMNGTLAGLVAITANCHAVSFRSAIVIGAVGSIVMMLSEVLLDKWRIDDAIGAVSVHLAPGIWGTLAVALLGDLEAIGTGLSRQQQFATQLSGVLTCGLWSFTLALFAFALLNRYVALRVSRKHEYLGLNVSEHGAQNELQELFRTMQSHAKTGNLQQRVSSSTLTEVGQISRWYNQVVDALERSTIKTNAIVMTAADGILTVDATTLEIQSANPAIGKIFGRDWLNITGKTLNTIIATDFPQGHEYALQALHPFLLQAVETGNVYDAIGLHKGGRHFPIEMAATHSELRTDTFLTIMVRDITDRKKAEAALLKSELDARQAAQQLQQALDELKRTQIQLLQREKMAGLGHLVAGIAHEINNPVGFIYSNLKHAVSYVDVMMGAIEHYQAERSPSTNAQTAIDDDELAFIKTDFPKLLSAMHSGTERIRNIVQSLRNFSRHDEAALKKVDVHEGLNNTLMLLTHRLNAQAKRPAINICKKYEESLPKIECFAGALNQVFFHIFSNAIDALEHHPSGTITVTTANEGDWITITIADNGKGIPKALQQQIFEPFFTTKPVGTGTGMGLAISYQIITNQHGGKLLCQSFLNHGTEFQLVLPAKHRPQVTHSKNTPAPERATDSMLPPSP